MKASHFERPLAQEELPQSYEENSSLLEDLKSKAIALGIFNEEFLRNVRFDIHADLKEEDGKVRSFLLKSGDRLEEAGGRGDPVEDVPVLSKAMVERWHQSGGLTADNLRSVGRIWLEGIDMKSLYSFEAITVHEIAHAQSFIGMPLEEGDIGRFFVNDDFKKAMRQLIKTDPVLKSVAKEIDFSRFRYNFMEWSEIYAILYQREFLRRTNPGSKALIEEWDCAVIRVSSHLKEATRVLSEKTDHKINPGAIYKENHTLSYLVAAAIERKFPNFKKRISFLESMKGFDAGGFLALGREAVFGHNISKRGEREPYLSEH